MNYFIIGNAGGTRCISPVDRWPVVHGELRAAVAKGLTGAHAGQHFWEPNLAAKGPKGGRLLGESHREGGWWEGALVTWLAMRQ
jgi:hypothetical protein